MEDLNHLIANTFCALPTGLIRLAIVLGISILVTPFFQKIRWNFSLKSSSQTLQLYGHLVC